LEKKFKIPVFTENDANCFVLGEKYFGKGKKYKNIAGVIIGTGLGTGIIINEKLYSGSNGGAGEFGQITYLKHNVEYYCSGKFFEKEYKMKGESLYERVLKNDAKAFRIFNEYGKHLGKALSIIINSTDPEIIILGGSASKAYRFFKNSMICSLKESVYRRTFQSIRITVSDNKDAALLGAASLCFKN